MPARFPQSASSLNWRIKPAYSSKVLAIYWPATADSVHRLYSADTSTTIITRSTSGASINGDGLLTGNVTGSGGVYFSDSKTGGLGTTEDGNYTLIASYWGDLFNGVGDVWAMGCAAPMDTFANRQSLRTTSYAWDFVRSGSTLGQNAINGADDVLAWMVVAIRQVPSDGTARFRAWANGAEITSLRSSTAPSASSTVGDASNALRFGGSATGTGNTRAWPECWIVATDLSVADMDAITADPSIVIEVVSGDTTPPTLTSPTGTGGVGVCSGTVSTDEGNGTLYAVATASATQPNVAQIKAGQDHTGAAALRAVSQSVTATGTQTVASGSITGGAGTRYLHYLHTDAASNDSNRVTSASFEVTGNATSLVVTVPDAAGQSGFSAAVLSTSAPTTGSTVIRTATSLTFNGSGQTTIDITGLGIAVGAYRWVTLTNSNGTPSQSPAPVAASGPVIAS
jgi:hypothetical protein